MWVATDIKMRSISTRAHGTLSTYADRRSSSRFCVWNPDIDSGTRPPLRKEVVLTSPVALDPEIVIIPRDAGASVDRAPFCRSRYALRSISAVYQWSKQFIPFCKHLHHFICKRPSFLRSRGPPSNNNKTTRLRQARFTAEKTSAKLK